MARAIRAVACAIACAGSIMAAGHAAGGSDQGYFVVVVGFLGFLLFGLFLIRTVAGTANFGQVMEYLFSPESTADAADND